MSLSQDGYTYTNSEGEKRHHPGINVSPEACEEVAHVHQNAYERLPRDAPNSGQRFHHGLMVEGNALLAIAGYLREIRDLLEPDIEVYEEKY